MRSRWSARPHLQISVSSSIWSCLSVSWRSVRLRAPGLARFRAVTARAVSPPQPPSSRRTDSSQESAAELADTTSLLFRDSASEGTERHDRSGTAAEPDDTTSLLFRDSASEGTERHDRSGTAAQTAARRAPPSGPTPPHCCSETAPLRGQSDTIGQALKREKDMPALTDCAA